ncbi:MAG: hypothetical protein IKT46_01490 [Clostridia bacterium]|nr:hypothetical protein [Clostridia bacterium]
MKKTVIKTVIIISVALILALVIAAVWLNHYLFGTVVSHNYNRYEKITEEYDCLPTELQFGEYKDRDFKYFQRNMIIFESHAYTVRLSYDGEEYAKQKSELDTEFSFCTQKLSADIEEPFKEPEFDMGDFHFRIAGIWEEGSILYEYPKIILFIGTNDTDNEIAYIFFEDLDQDLIYGSFEDFLRDDCGWKD